MQFLHRIWYFYFEFFENIAPSADYSQMCGASANLRNCTHEISSYVYILTRCRCPKLKNLSLNNSNNVKDEDILYVMQNSQLQYLGVRGHHCTQAENPELIREGEIIVVDRHFPPFSRFKIRITCTEFGQRKNAKAWYWTEEKSQNRSVLQKEQPDKKFCFHVFKKLSRKFKFVQNRQFIIYP